jgi:hypothetical protein
MTNRLYESPAAYKDQNDRPEQGEQRPHRIVRVVKPRMCQKVQARQEEQHAQRHQKRTHYQRECRSTPFPYPRSPSPVHRSPNKIPDKKDPHQEEEIVCVKTEHRPGDPIPLRSPWNWIEGPEQHSGSVQPQTDQPGCGHIHGNLNPVPRLQQDGGSYRLDDRQGQCQSHFPHAEAPCAPPGITLPSK